MDPKCPPEALKIGSKLRNSTSGIETLIKSNVSLLRLSGEQAEEFHFWN